jgi:hypothetical protein
MLLFLLVCSGCGQATPEDLYARAVESGSVVEQEEAAVQLARSGDGAVEHLRRLLDESPTAEVRAAAAQGLGENRDVDSLPKLIDAMEDESVLVRTRAGIAVKHIMGMDFGFNPQADVGERFEVVTSYRMFWKEALGPESEHRELNRRRMGPQANDAD